MGGGGGGGAQPKKQRVFEIGGKGGELQLKKALVGVAEGVFETQGKGRIDM